MRLFDAHCHLQDSRLGPDVEEILRRARDAGLAGFLSCGSSPNDWEALASICRQHPDVIPAFGLHPWYLAERSPQWLDDLGRRLDRWPTAAVGEIGLDHAIEDSDPREQMEVFVQQLLVARGRGRAVSIHCRRAWAALEEALDRVGPLPRGFVVHSFSGSKEVLMTLEKRGGVFSFSGSITYPHNRRGRAAAAAAPLDRLLIETDAPDLPPFGVDRNRPNEPAHLPSVLRELATLRGMDPEDLADRLWLNAQRHLGAEHADARR